MHRRWKANSDTAQDGLTIVELIVVSAVSAVLLIVLSGVFINGLQTNAASLDRDSTTARAQTIAMTLQTSIRDADVTSVTVDATRLSALVSTEGGWVCRTWELAGGDLTYRASSTAGPAVLATGVSGTLDERGRAFSVVSGSAGTVEYGLAVAEGSARAEAQGSVTAQGKDRDGGGETC
ncbi:PulJ/GspJ family protein [Propionicicella superfundia]|uniref:PulJ/GspJ family protein n=1 Tax=Propionicicella superfundia TaxID=348582 RepID=UPI0003FC84F3|nr:hypothetical protein [Propionicicella superfundia]